MRAAILREYGEPLDIHEVPDPEPGPDGAVVRVTACGVCRSDWHAWAGHGEWADDRVPRGQVLGHEPAGEVVTVGELRRPVRAGRPRRRSVLARRRHLSALSAGTRERL